MNQPRTLSYKIGDTTASGRKIALIYGQSATCGVYQDESGLVHFETVSDTFTPTESTANQLFDELSVRISEFLPAEAHARARGVLAFALYRGFTAPDEKGAAASFAEPQRYIERAISLRARLWYTGAGTISAAVLGLSMWLLWPPVGSESILPMVGAIAGMGGAWTSVLQRVNQLAPPSALETSVVHGLQGGSRILLGAVFGFVAVAAMKADLLLGIANTSVWATGVFGYLAGFSERFVPEFLSKLEGRALEKQ